MKKDLTTQSMDDPSQPHPELPARQVTVESGLQAAPADGSPAPLGAQMQLPPHTHRAVLLGTTFAARLGHGMLVAGLLALGLGTNAFASVPDANSVYHGCLSLSPRPVPSPRRATTP